jgi:hypothetical protein
MHHDGTGPALLYRRHHCQQYLHRTSSLPPFIIHIQLYTLFLQCTSHHLPILAPAPARASLRYNTHHALPSHPQNYCGIHITRARPRGRLPQPHGNKTDNYTPHDAPLCADSQRAVLRVPSAINVLHCTPPDAVVGRLREHMRHFQTPKC